MTGPSAYGYGACAEEASRPRNSQSPTPHRWTPYHRCARSCCPQLGDDGLLRTADRQCCAGPVPLRAGDADGSGRSSREAGSAGVGRRSEGVAGRRSHRRARRRGMDGERGMGPSGAAGARTPADPVEPGLAGRGLVRHGDVLPDRRCLHTAVPGPKRPSAVCPRPPPATGVPLLFFLVVMAPVVEFASDDADWDRGFPAFVAYIWQHPAPGPTWFLEVLLLFSVGYATLRAIRPTRGAEPRG